MAWYLTDMCAAPTSARVCCELKMQHPHLYLGLEPGQQRTYAVAGQVAAGQVQHSGYSGFFNFGLGKKDRKSVV